MRALTLTQPWAGLVASGLKLVENRPRAMIKSADFGKVFAIHASREIDDDVYDRIKEAAPELFTQRGYATWYHRSRVTSAVIAVATLADALYIGGNSDATTATMLDKAFGVGQWPDGWDGDEAIGDELLEKVFADGSVQPLLPMFGDPKGDA